MKISFLLFFLLIAGIYSCKKDNYSPPGSKLTGALMYNGDSVNVEYDRVPFLLYQPGLGKVGQVGAFSDRGGVTSTTFEQNGTYSALLYDGEYKFIIPNGQGPFLWKQLSNGNPDTLAITVKGSTNANIEVTPYYMIRNPQFSYSTSDSLVKVTFKAEQIITGANAKDIERVTLYISKTRFVPYTGGDPLNKKFESSADLSGGSIIDPNNISIALKIFHPIVPVQNYLFARVGLKIAGVEDLIFSPLQQISY